MPVWLTILLLLAVSVAHVFGEPDIKTIDDILATPTPMHGAIEKQGGLDESIWRSLWGSSAIQDFLSWYRKLLVDSDGTEVEAPFPFKCQIFINHEYKYIYVRHPKTGSSSIFIKELGGRCGIDSDKPTCMYPLEQNTTPEQARQWWNEYLVFTFVRNPWARAASALQFLAAINHNPNCGMQFEEFCRSPQSFGYVCIKNDNCCKMGAEFDWLHLQGQAQCMFTADGRPAVDFVGRSEHSDDDYQQLVQLINRRLPPGVQPIPSTKLSIMNKGLEWVARAEHTTVSDAQNEYKNRYSKEYEAYPSCLASIGRAYKADVEWLKYTAATSAPASQ